MSITRGQITLLALVVIFFALQLLPHRITTLHGTFTFDWFYPLTAVLLAFLIVIGVAVSLVMWTSTRELDSRLKHRDWCVTFILMLGAAIGTTVFSSAYSRRLPTGSFVQEFDQQLWSKQSSSEFVESDVTIRQKMLGHVIETVVKGNSKEAIINVLGPSESDGFFASSGRELIYCTGPQRDSIFTIDSEWLLWFVRKIMSHILLEEFCHTASKEQTT